MASVAPTFSPLGASLARRIPGGPCDDHGMSREDQEHVDDENVDHAAEGDHPAVAALARARAEVIERLRALRGGFDEIVAASADSNADDEHDPEGATIAFERAQVDALARQAQSQLEEIQDAFARVAAGTYGRCEACGQPIPAERLAVRPTARRCVACASGGRRA